MRLRKKRAFFAVLWNMAFVIFWASFTMAAPQKLAPVTKIVFKGDLPFAAKELKKILTLKEGQPATEWQIKESQTRLLRFLSQKGFLNATIDSLKQEHLPDEKNGLLLVFYVHAGPRFRIRNLKIISDSLSPAQYRRIVRSRPGEFFDQQRIREDGQNILKYAAEQGFPFAKVDVQPRLLTVKESAVDLGLYIKEGARVFVKGVVVEGNHYTRPAVVLRALYFKPGMRYRRSWEEKIQTRLEKLEIFQSVSPPQLIRLSKDSVLVVVRVQEGNATTFDGLVGYVPAQGTGRVKSQQGYFTGLLNFSFRNLFGTGRRLKVFWEKADRLSENFLFQYLEPWIWGQPINVGLSFARQVKDTLFIAWDFKLSSTLNFNDRFSLFLHFTRHTVLPDSIARATLGMVRSRTYGIESGLQYDTRDFILNPQKGIFYKAGYRLGLKQNSGDVPNGQNLSRNSTINLFSMQFEGYQKIFKRQILAVKWNIQRIKGEALQLSDYFWFGGSQSVRGYRERQFSGYLVSWMNLEYRFVTGPDSRVFVFTDLGFYRNAILAPHSQFLQGMGLGLRFPTPLGVMGVDYGLARGEGFNQGKIHFGLTSRF